jgi:hypothetical protein
MGDHDRVIQPEEGREMARRIPGAQIVTITGTSHLSYLERPEIFNELVLRFLDCSEAASFVTGIALFTPTRNNTHRLASQFPLVCPQLRHRLAEVFTLLKSASGTVRTTHGAAYALLFHWLCCLLVYSLYNFRIIQSSAAPQVCVFSLEITTC